MKPLTIISPTLAQEAILALDAQLARTAPEIRSAEFGSIEGIVVGGATYYGIPAIKLKERQHGYEVTCSLSEDIARAFGPGFSLAEVWAGRRVLVSGRITYSNRGNIKHVHAFHIEQINPRPLSYRDIADPNFTGGMRPAEYVTANWNEDGG